MARVVLVVVDEPRKELVLGDPDETKDPLGVGAVADGLIMALLGAADLVGITGANALTLPKPSLPRARPKNKAGTVEIFIILFGFCVDIYVR